MVLKCTCETCECFCSVLNLRKLWSSFVSSCWNMVPICWKAIGTFPRRNLPKPSRSAGCSGQPGMLCWYFFRQVWGTPKDGCLDLGFKGFSRRILENAKNVCPKLSHSCEFKRYVSNVAFIFEVLYEPTWCCQRQWQHIQYIVCLQVQRSVDPVVITKVNQ